MPGCTRAAEIKRSVSESPCFGGWNAYVFSVDPQFRMGVSGSWGLPKFASSMVYFGGKIPFSKMEDEQGHLHDELETTIEFCDLPT